MVHKIDGKRTLKKVIFIFKMYISIFNEDKIAGFEYAKLFYRCKIGKIVIALIYWTQQSLSKLELSSEGAATVQR